MQHPYIANANANLRLDQMLKDAEVHRQMKRISDLKAGNEFFNAMKERIPVLKGHSLDKSANSPA
ncbi:MAG: hypothetical protein ACK2U1_03195 [Anaerolineales bacterium]|jgi:hypothetical protein